MKKKQLLILSMLASLYAFPVQGQTAGMTRVYDYQPAPGQFINTTTSAYQDGFTKEEVINYAQEALTKKPGQGMVTLGAFGGSIIVGFDHTIANAEGEYDFKIYGNAFANGAEPGIVMVSRDTNGNGLPDDEWFELAGSEYAKETTLKNYKVTYYRPESDDQDVRWTDNLGGEGVVPKNTFHKQSYYPKWISEDSYTVIGTRVAGNAVNAGTDEAPNWQLATLDWGYADNYPNTDEKSNFKIDWAVDRNGTPVKLNGIDFIKVYTGVQQECGWVGETSTEFSGAEDLHPETAAKAEDPVDYTTGTFFLNEDWFGHSDGTLNYLTGEGRFIYRAFGQQNEGAALGTTTQFATIYGDKLFVVSKQGKRLIVADAKTLKSLAVLTELGTDENEHSLDGRAFVGIHPGKGYISTNEGIVIFNIGNLTTGKTIEGITGEVGLMIRTDKYVFAVRQTKGISVIDPETDRVVYNMEGNYISIAQSADGTVWGAKPDGLTCIDPYTLASEEIAVTNAISYNMWAWNAGGFCADIRDNILFWNSSDKIVRYEIEKGTETVILNVGELTPDDAKEKQTMYGTGLRIDPRSHQLVVSTVESGWGAHYESNWIHFVNAENGTVEKTLRPENYYWFPALTLFPDAKAPAVLLPETLEMMPAATQVYPLRQFITDEDNLAAAIVPQIVSNSNEELIQASIVNGELIIHALDGKERSTDLTLQFCSNGKQTEPHTLSIRIKTPQGVTYDVLNMNGMLAEPEKAWLSTDNSTPDGVNYKVLIHKDEFVLNHYWSTWGFAGGFTYSNQTDVTTPGYTNLSAITGTGQQGDTYLIAKSDEFTPATVSFKDNAEYNVQGTYVTNSTYAYLSMAQGDEYAKKFGGDDGTDPDWFLLTATGLDSKGEATSEVSTYLADYRSMDASQGSLLNRWKWFDLSPLGKVAAVKFSLTSSDNGEYGMNTPGYFCMDALTIYHDDGSSVHTEKSNDFRVFYANKVLHFVGMENCTVTLSSLTGAVNETFRIHSNRESRPLAAAPGVYIVRCEKNGEVSVLKVLIK